MPAGHVSNSKSRALILALAIGAVGIWLFFQPPWRHDVDESSLRDTTGIELVVTEARSNGSRAVVVRCLVTNRTDRSAESVVLTAEIASEDGQVIASNPLVNVLRLAPGESRTIAAMIPLPSVATFPLHPQGKVNLVRWSE